MTITEKSTNVGVDIHADVPYFGDEPGRHLPNHPSYMTDAFAVAVPLLPFGARPIIDDVNGGCVGFMYERVKNVWHIYDITGQHVGIEEAPLEAPLFDPFDFVLMGASVVQFMRSGLSAVTRQVAGRAAVSSRIESNESIASLPSSQTTKPTRRAVAIYRDNCQAHGKRGAVCTNPYSTFSH
jgi:hypothetical protein